uniref:Basal body-orientation factor 1 n=1 Tax=Ciona intestinalis TaxID=7719 RepID=F6UGT8_CIOIN|nr:basal body-orientation factor 1-like [Ciona intestinalis]|eukprot:XP_002122599.1 basal body-orientation factor 1-like [Ciona intestinalis]
MPKKGKKGGKGKKGKKSGGKKGKKSGKSSKMDRDAELSMATANAKLWASRLDVTEKSRNEYRETCKRMAGENEKLHDTLFQSEKDTIEVVTYLKKGDMEKDEEITRYEQELKDLKKQSRKDKETIMAEFSSQISDLESRLEQRTGEVKLMQSELKLVKEFRRKRAAMQAELDEIRESMFVANKEHKDTLQKMEHKFFEEKIRLEREASQKIAELAERAHTEAIANLDETTRSVYKENIRLNEALSYHIKESQSLQTRCDSLTTEVESLRANKELSDATVKEKVTESKRHKGEIHGLREKVEQLEKALSSMVHEFRDEKRAIEQRARMETVASGGEIQKLQRMLQIKDKEMNKVKVVAKNIVEQRTNVEIFFLSALEKVRTEIALNRAQYVQAAQSAYHRKMLAAHSGQADFPKIRTFRKNDSSTNSVFADLSEAENWSSLGNQVDIRDLTWEQKEKVLRLLFARMNGLKTKSNVQRTQHSAPPLSITDKTNRPKPIDHAPNPTLDLMT